MSECTHHHISRRGFGTMALATTGLALLPFGARAAGPKVDNWAITCMDFRLVEKAMEFLNTPSMGGPGTDQFDHTAMAGASLAGTSTGYFRHSQAGFWQQAVVAVELHEAKKIFVVDHLMCGAYQKEFNLRDDQLGLERMRHLQEMAKLNTSFRSRYPRVTLEFYLMAAPGTVPYPLPPERIHI